MIYEKLHLKDYFGFLGENGADPTLEVYLPYNMSEMKWQDRKRPCMVVCPGGGYSKCSQREAEPIALQFLPDGFNVFLLNYTCAPAKFPTQIREVAAVMELIYKNADIWNCDTSKVSIIGFSAGGHLAAHYSTMFDCKEVREVFPQSKSVNASILSYPVITAEVGKCHKGSFQNLVGHYPLSEEELNYFCADRCVKEKTPPAFIWHTVADATVPVINSILYATALSNYKIPFELQIYPEGRHGLSTADLQTYNLSDVDKATKYAHKWLSELKNWLKYMDLC